MTSPSVRRQREYDRQQPIPQPHFGFGAPAQARVNWQERLEQGFQTRHAQRMQNRGAQRGRRDERPAPVAGPSIPITNWGYHGFQPRHMQANHGGQPQDIERQRRHAEDENRYAAVMHNRQLQLEAQRQTDYDQEALQHQAHLAELRQQRQPDRQAVYDQEALQHVELQRQRQMNRDQEALRDQAHLAELQRQRQMDRDQEALRHQAHLAELQRQRQMDRDQEALRHQVHLAELQHQRQMDRDQEALRHQAHLAELQRQRQMDHDQEVLRHQAHLAGLQQQEQQQQHQRQMDYHQEASQHQHHLDELEQQQQDQRQIDYDREALQHQNDVAQQQQADQQAEAEHVQQAVQNNQALAAMPKGCRPYQEPAHRHYLGPMTVECPKCHALHFMSERLTHSSNANPRFGMCCLQGQISLPPLSEPPQQLHRLLTSSAPRARKFRENIRQYNTAFAFTSVGVEIDHTILNGRGPYSFRIHGGLCHKMGALQQTEGRRPSYAQLYIYDQQAALAFRNSRNANLDHVVMGELQEMLNAVNPFVPLYRQAYQIMQETPPQLQANLSVAIVLEPGEDRRRYNLPTVDEVAAIIPGHGEEEVDENRQIALRYKNGGLWFMSHLHPLYSPLHYVLLFPKGDQGFHNKIPVVEQEGVSVRSPHVSQRCYYTFRLHPRPMEPSDLFRGGRLFQQYVVDAWASIEQSELNWVMKNQKTIRADLYHGLRDAMRDAEGVDMSNMGRRIVLPSSHPGSSRHMYQLFQDSMAIARHCGKPDLFITMTANPNWPEIQENLFSYQADDNDPDGERRQTASDRPDIVARVFAQKMKAMLKDIKDGLFGEVMGFVFTIEFQKRGLPHIHLLLFLKQAYKIRDAAHVNSIISAQIPDPDVHPVLYATVTKCMMHGPCGPEKRRGILPLVNGQICGKPFPKC